MRFRWRPLTGRGRVRDFEVKSGEFVWREPGSRHVAWMPEGGLMLAMFQIPNKFRERDGRVTDLSGRGVEGLSLSPSASGVGASRIERSRVAAWWNGRHSRLKICFWETGVPVRVRPRPPFGAKNAGPGCIREFESSATVPFKPLPTWPSGKEFSKILVGFWRHSLVAVAHRSGSRGPRPSGSERRGPRGQPGGGGWLGAAAARWGIGC
jgi:hypothetical protein